MRLTVLVLLLVFTASAQAPRPPAVVSPEIGPDRGVTFRIYAPKAAEVLLTGDWMGRKDKPISLSKGDDGVWSGVAGPLNPNAYLYSFIVDGIRLHDPASSDTVISAGRFPQSRVVIPGDSPLVSDIRDVPKGTVHVEFFWSTMQGRERGYYVYTPPAYNEGGKSRLPVLVLLPGTPATEADWFTVGLANRILDNLIAQRGIKPMLVLMPRADVLTKGGTRADNLREFEPLLMREVLPHFEKRYRTQKSPDLRAIAGYSLGGELALTVGLRHPELFRSAGSFGGSVFEKEFEDRFGKSLASAEITGGRYRLIWIGCGAGDLLLPGNRKFSEVLMSKKVQHTFREVDGYHSMPTFRALFIEFVQLLFR